MLRWLCYCDPVAECLQNACNNAGSTALDDTSKMHLKGPACGVTVSVQGVKELMTNEDSNKGKSRH